MRVAEWNWLGEDQREVSVKVRSLAPAVPARVTASGSASRSAEYGVAPGQAAVLYDGTRMLGGGWIAETRRGPSVDGCRRRIARASSSSGSADGATEVLLIKPGGPFWRNKDAGAWMIPKGMVEPGEAPAEAALREFAEETGHAARRPPIPAGHVPPGRRQDRRSLCGRGRPRPAAIRSNEFEMEWPPRSGRRERFPKSRKRDGCRLPTHAL